MTSKKTCDLQRCLTEWNDKHSFPSNKLLKNERWEQAETTLADAATMLNLISERLEKLAQAGVSQGDHRLQRLQLHVEETAELATAMLELDEEALADALGDLDYVNAGTYLTYWLPQEPIQAEIHRSNMTRPRRSLEDPRMRDKTGYEPPRLREIIDDHRRQCL